MTVDEDSADEIRRRVAALEDEVETLREEVAAITRKDLPLLKATLRAMADADIEAIDELPTAGRSFRRQLEELETTLASLDRRLALLGDIEADKSTKEQKIAAVLAFADNKRDVEQSTIAITAHEVKGCVGVSRRYTYDLMEAMADDLDGVSVREAKQVTTSTGGERKKKAILIDCEQVHEGTEYVNSFTTGDGTIEQS